MPVRRQADRLLAQPPVEYVLIGPRLLDKSRAAVERIYTLGLVYRIEGDRKYFDRLRCGEQEPESAVPFHGGAVGRSGRTAR